MRIAAPTVIARQELYDLIWSESMSAVAPRFEVSPVELSRICAANNIPRPSGAWWGKRLAGKSVAWTPLPPLAPDQDDKIMFGVPITDLPPAIAF